MLVLHLIGIASQSARDKSVAIKVLLLTILKLERNTLFAISKALVNVLIIDLFIESSGLALTKAWQIAIIG